MNATAQESPPSGPESSPPQSWSLTRWIVYVMVALAIHVGLIFIFGNRKPIVPRSVTNAPQIRLATTRSELQSLDDPTLFALPHPQGFAAKAWRQLPEVAFAPFRWTEPPQLLDLPAAKLGSAFLHFASTNVVRRVEVEALTAVPTTPPVSSDPPTSLKQHSTVSTSGSITRRRWLNAPAVLRSWPAADLLTNSVVRIVVDTDGQVFSPALLPPGSGSKAADQYALEIARAARFARLPRSAGQMIGTLVFEWHTVPVPDTNAPAGKP
ncbi:MAG TPA: hypothetical protein VFZ59_13295 [Verrucomicrobiae bacterium]|nr:hypothetical protein [Verrucomicrobiae bacterium]